MSGGGGQGEGREFIRSPTLALAASQQELPVELKIPKDAESPGDVIEVPGFLPMGRGKGHRETEFPNILAHLLPLPSARRNACLLHVQAEGSFRNKNMLRGILVTLRGHSMAPPQWGGAGTALTWLKAVMQQFL